MDLRKRITSRIDWIMIGFYILFVVFGWMNIYSATSTESESAQLLDMGTRAGRQFIFILAAMVLAVVIMLIDSKLWVFLSYPTYVAAILLLILVLIAGTEIKGAKSWFVFGPVSIQPAEFAKIATVMIIAKVFSGFGFSIHRWKHLLKSFMLIMMPVALILLQNDTGSALVFFVLVLVFFREGMNETFLVFGVIAIVLFLMTLLVPLPVLYVIVSFLTLLIVAFRNSSWKMSLQVLAIMLLTGAGVLLSGNLLNLHKISTGTMFLLSAVIAFPLLLLMAYRKRVKNLYYIFLVWFGAMLLIGSVNFFYDSVLEDHQRSRINQVLGIDSDPLGAGYNVNQSKIAIGSGGFTGKGFMKGTQTRFDFVPEQSTDFIFCTVGEEWGFWGSSLLIILYSLFLIRIIQLAERQRSTFSRVFGYGVFSIFFFHFLINIGMTLGIIPVIGIPLPFFSYGGSSLWSFTVLLFIFLHLDTDRFEVVA